MVRWDGCSLFLLFKRKELLFCRWIPDLWYPRTVRTEREGENLIVYLARFWHVFSSHYISTFYISVAKIEQIAHRGIECWINAISLLTGQETMSVRIIMDLRIIRSCIQSTIKDVSFCFDQYGPCNRSFSFLSEKANRAGRRRKMARCNVSDFRKRDKCSSVVLGHRCFVRSWKNFAQYVWVARGRWVICGSTFLRLILRKRCYFDEKEQAGLCGMQWTVVLCGLFTLYCWWGHELLQQKFNLHLQMYGVWACIQSWISVKTQPRSVGMMTKTFIDKLSMNCISFTSGKVIRLYCDVSYCAVWQMVFVPKYTTLEDTLKVEDNLRRKDNKETLKKSSVWKTPTLKKGADRIGGRHLMMGWIGKSHWMIVQIAATERTRTKMNVRKAIGARVEGTEIMTTTLVDRTPRCCLTRSPLPSAVFFCTHFSFPSASWSFPSASRFSHLLFVSFPLKYPFFCLLPFFLVPQFQWWDRLKVLETIVH